MMQCKHTSAVVTNAWRNYAMEKEAKRAKSQWHSVFKGSKLSQMQSLFGILGTICLAIKSNPK